jgi:MoaA/NifB/PqqE/SkfB family radical SAM enzyme
MNQSFCVLPWVNLTTDTNGDIKPCCVSIDNIKKEDGTNYNLGKDSIETIYNSKSMIALREKMLNGTLVPGCRQCYNEEKYGGVSNRLHYNKKFEHIKIEGSTVNPIIRYFDLRFGNLCNLSCRSCNPESSSQLQRELEDISKSNNIPIRLSVREDINSWYKTDICKNNVENQLDNLETLYITGGEPTIIQHNIDLLSFLVSTGKCKNINLSITSNMTNSNPKFYNLIKEFKTVLFMVSLDGYGDIQEYIRYPSKWSMMDTNIKRLVELSDNITITPTPVIQITNLNKCVELFEYFESYNRKANKMVIDMYPINLTFPPHLNLLYLPLDFKMKCWEKIEFWINKYCKYQTPNFYSVMSGIQTKCKTDVSLNEIKRNLSQYMKYNLMFDTHRNVRLLDVNPELVTEIHNYL